MYYKIACEQVRTYHQRDAEFHRFEVELQSSDKPTRTSHQMETCYEEREQAAVIAITFSAMSLEAFFYDYAA